MSRDPETYPDPDVFIPERFLNEQGRLDFENTLDPSNFAFGFGRRYVSVCDSRTWTHEGPHCDPRICPGRHFAEASMFILCASVLFAFDIKPPVGEDGCPIKLEYTTTANAVVS